MPTHPEAPAAERAPCVPVAASSRGSVHPPQYCYGGRASRSASAHRELPEFARLTRFQSAIYRSAAVPAAARPHSQDRSEFQTRPAAVSAAGETPALRSGARASARFAVRTPVASKSNSDVTKIRALKRRERRAPLTPEASNMNSRGCQPTVNRKHASRPRRGRTIHRATICSTLSGSGKISGTWSVGWHPRLFTLHPFGIHFGLRRQSAAATALSHAQRSHKLAAAIARPKSGIALRLPPHSKTRLVHDTIHPFNALTI
jgi:hypothetical protein